MVKHTLVGALVISSLAFAAPTAHPAPAVHPAGSVAPPPGPAYRSPAPPPTPQRWQRGDDGAEANRLLEAFERAAARRDVVMMRQLDARLATFLDHQLIDARAELGRGGFGRPASAWARRQVDELTSLERRLDRLEGRVDRSAVAQKRGLYTQAVALARQGHEAARRG